MSEIDPWAMREASTLNPGSVGLAGSISSPAERIRPLDRRWPRVTAALGVLSVIVAVAEVFSLDHAAALAGQLNAMILADQFPSTSQSARLGAADNTVGTVSWIALAVFVAAVAALGAWQRSLGEALGSVGARRAVLARARYGYLRAAWLVSLLFALFLQATSTSDYIDSYVDAVDHDHLYMLLNAVRALLGAVVVYFANRLRRVADEAVGLLNGTSVPY
jgi:hypothetical protein